MDDISFPCPNCDQTLKAPAGKVGKKARCPNCSTLVVIPSSGITTPDVPEGLLRLADEGPPSEPRREVDLADLAGANAPTRADNGPPARHEVDLPDLAPDGRTGASAPPGQSDDDLPRAPAIETIMADFTLEKSPPARPAAPLGPILDTPEQLPELTPALPPAPAPLPAPSPPEVARPASAPAEDAATYGLLGDDFAPPPTDEKPATGPGKTGRKSRRKSNDEEGVRTAGQLAATAVMVGEAGPEAETEDRPRRKRGAALRPIPERPERWQLVHKGLALVTLGMALWFGAVLLHRVFVALGLGMPMEYALVAEKELVNPNQPVEVGTPRIFYTSSFLVGLILGEEHYTLGSIVLCLALVAMLAHLGVNIMGYVMCLPVPPGHGTRRILIGCLAVAGTSCALVLLFQLLPALGLSHSPVIMFFTPELAMLDANIDRLVAIHLAWSAAPGLLVYAALLFHMVVLAEPVLLAMFLRASALTLKVESLERTSAGLIKVGLGTAFIQLAYLLLANTGTSLILLWVLRVLYILGTAFLVVQLLWFVFALRHARRVLARVLKGEWVD
jgi:hypothetical protein